MEHIENDAKYNGLTVNQGVSQPPVVNPYLKKRRPRPMPSAAEMVEGILRGDMTDAFACCDPCGEPFA